MSSLYNTLCIKHKLVVSIYSNTETSLALPNLNVMLILHWWAVMNRWIEYIAWIIENF